MNKLQKILLGVLAVQAALALWLYLPHQKAAGGSEALFGALKAEEITAVTIQDNENQSIEFKKSGESWVIPAADDYPCDTDRVTKALEAIPQVLTTRLVTRTTESHRQLQVADDAFLRRVDLTLKDGSQVRFYVGTAPATGATHIRKDGSDQVYLTNKVSSFDLAAQFSKWIDTQYVALNQQNITAVSIQNANGSLDFAKDEAGNWTLKQLKEGDLLSTSYLDSALASLTSLRMTAPLGKQEKPAYGLSQPAATIVKLTVTDPATGQGEKLTLLIGAEESESGDYYAKYDGSAYYVRISGYNAENFTTRKYEDFVAAPPAVEQE